MKLKETKLWKQFNTIFCSYTTEVFEHKNVWMLSNVWKVISVDSRNNDAIKYQIWYIIHWLCWFSDMMYGDARAQRQRHQKIKVLRHGLEEMIHSQSDRMNLYSKFSEWVSEWAMHVCIQSTGTTGLYYYALILTHAPALATHDFIRDKSKESRNQECIWSNVKGAV